MNTLEIKRLEERVFQEVHTVLTEGDLDYLKGLSREGLFELLDTELKFMGLYKLSNLEAPGIITKILHENIDNWRESYLGKRRSEP
jgi:hypothetical protein